MWNQMSLLKVWLVITLFCREFKYCRIYALFVLIFWAQKCACASFYAFCMSVLHPQYCFLQNIVKMGKNSPSDSIGWIFFYHKIFEVAAAGAPSRTSVTTPSHHKYSWRKWTNIREANEQIFLKLMNLLYSFKNHIQTYTVKPIPTTASYSQYYQGLYTKIPHTPVLPFDRCFCKESLL